MKRVILILMLIPFLGIGQERESQILHIYELKLKMNEGEKFRQGMKKWKDCYLENKGVDNWSVWNRVQGESGMVAVTFFMDKWAEMDEDPTDADNACRTIFQSDIFPYVENMEHHITTSMPEFSKEPSTGNKVYWVTFFRSNNNSDFTDVIKEVSATFKEAKGDRLGYWYDFAGGGQESADYMVSIPYKNFAGMDEEWTSPWKVYEEKHGKEKMEKMREKFRAATDDSWSYIYSLNENLSN
ncbi:MAG: hypothetical protein KJP01_02680 [Gramella sp.]|nr:hypothetical protein [Christiangramia sp.]MBT8319011.1 hypothetical protein [Christiangramia sp.]